MNRARVRPTRSKSHLSRMGGPDDDNDDQPTLPTSPPQHNGLPCKVLSPLARSDRSSISPSSPASPSSAGYFANGKHSVAYGIGVIHEGDEKAVLAKNSHGHPGESEHIKLRDYTSNYLNCNGSHNMNGMKSSASPDVAASPSTPASSASSVPGAYAMDQSREHSESTRTRMSSIRTPSLNPFRRDPQIRAENHDETLSQSSEAAINEEDNEQHSFLSREGQSGATSRRAPSNVHVSAQESRLSMLTDGSPLVTATVVADHAASGIDGPGDDNNDDGGGSAHRKGQIPCSVLRRDRRVRCFLFFNALVTFGLLASLIYVVLVGSPGIIDNNATEDDRRGGEKVLVAPPPTATPTTAAPTMAPTAAPTTLQQALRSQLETYAGEPDVVTALDDPLSPQSEALRWIERDPNLYKPYRLAQRFALATLQFVTKRNLSAGEDQEDPNEGRKLYVPPPSSPAFDVFDDRLYSMNECNWGNTTTIVCDENNRIFQIDFSLRWMEGTLPPELALLTELQWLAIWGNRLWGTVPIVYNRFTNLDGYDIQGNKFGGPMDPAFFTMTSLKYLHVGYNGFTGSLSSDIAQLSNLVSISLSNLHDFGGLIPEEFYSLTKLTAIDMYDTGFSGTISTRIRQLSSLQQLEIGNNKFSGTLPTELGTLTDCWSLDLYKNQFTGTIPSEIGRITYLGCLDLSHNELTGSIPTDMFRMTSNDLIWMFSLAQNQLNGTLPTQVGRLIKTQGEFLLDNNEFTGPIPTELGRLTKLTSLLHLDNNRFTGPIPTQLGQLTLLTQLQLSNNPQMTGTLPSELGLLSRLSAPLEFTNIGFDENSTVPDEICDLIPANLTEEEIQACECVANITVNCDMQCSCCSVFCF